MQGIREVPVPAVIAVADEDPLVAGQHTAGVDRVRGPVPEVHVRQEPGAGQVHIPHSPGGAGRGLVRVHRLSLPQQLLHPVHEPARPEQRGRLRADPGDPARGHADPGHLDHQRRCPPRRDIVPAGQVRGLRVRLRAEARPRPYPGRQDALGDLPAARASLRLHDMLADLGFRRGPDVGDLVAALREDFPARQARAAPAAFRRRVPVPVLRVIYQAHRRAGLAVLLPGTALPLLPQRPVPRLLPVLLIRAVRRRRPR